MKARTQSPLKSLPGWVRVTTLVLALILLAGIGLNFYLDSWVTRHLKEAVNKGTKGLYTLNYQKVDVNILAGSISIHKGELRVDSSLQGKMLRLDKQFSIAAQGDFPLISIKRIHWMKLFFAKGLVAGEIFIPSPNLRLSIVKASKQDSIGKNSIEVDEFFQSNFQGFQVKRMVMDSANVDYLYMEEGRKGPTIYHLKKLSIDSRDLRFNKIAKDSTKTISIGNTELNLSEFEYRTGDSLYLMKLKDLNCQSANKSVSISRFFILPRLTEKDYATKLSYQKERNEVSLKDIKLEGVDLKALVRNSEMNIQQAVVGDGNWNIFLTRIPPLPRQREKVVPSQSLLSISEKVYVANLKIKRLQLDYREFNVDTKETGQIKFNDLSGTAINITNEKTRIEKNPHLVVDLTAKLMGSGDLKARFDFLLSDTTGKFSVDARLGRMDATQLNPGFMPLNKVEIKKGIVDEMKCHGSGNQHMLSGNVSLKYHDLHIAVLEKDKQADTLKRKTFVSLVANILVKNDNPKKNEPIRIANNVVLKRDPRKSYFNLLWMALFTGIAKIVAPKQGLM